MRLGSDCIRTTSTSARTTRHYPDTHWPAGIPVYAVGTSGLHDALFADRRFVFDDHTPQVVVFGHDPQFNYAACCTATAAIVAGAAFIGTNPDVTVPSALGLVPECGALLAYLQAATGIVPTVIGKPAPTMFHSALALLGGDPAHTLVIGDRLDTDVAGARSAGLAAALVLTGVTAATDVGDSPHAPDAIFADLPALLAAWHDTL